MKWQIRYAPSLGALEDTPENVWGTKPYLDEFQPTLFMGLYGLNDFVSLWRHQGRKAILWCGSDIRHFMSGYWLDTEGRIKIDPSALAEWINKNCESYVENGIEAEALKAFGIESKIVPSFLGDVSKYPITYTRRTDRPQVYASVSGDDFALYGWEMIEMVAGEVEEVDFHLYGNTKPWTTKHNNVFVHGRVPKEQMNDEIKNMNCGLRVLEFDGFSEILAKSVLWGQYPISFIDYPYIDSFKTKEQLVNLLKGLKNKKEPNEKARNYYLRELNKYPWNSNL